MPAPESRYVCSSCFYRSTSGRRLPGCREGISAAGTSPRGFCSQPSAPPQTVVTRVGGCCLPGAQGCTRIPQRPGLSIEWSVAKWFSLSHLPPNLTPRDGEPRRLVIFRQMEEAIPRGGSVCSEPGRIFCGRAKLIDPMGEPPKPLGSHRPKPQSPNSVPPSGPPPAQSLHLENRGNLPIALVQTLLPPWPGNPGKQAGREGDTGVPRSCVALDKSSKLSEPHSITWGYSHRPYNYLPVQKQNYTQRLVSEVCLCRFLWCHL